MANEPGIGALDPETCGILLSLWALGGEESALERLGEDRRAVCTRAWRELLVAGEAERSEILDAWRGEAANFLPQGLDRLHPSWIDCALEGEPEAIRRIVLSGLAEHGRPSAIGMSDSASATNREVVCLALGWLAPLCENACGPLARSLAGLAFDELLTEVTRRGARVVGQSLAGAAPSLRARAMAAAGGPWARVIGAVSAESLSDADRKSAMTYANARLPDSARTPSDRLLQIGLVVLKSELVAEHPGSIYCVAGRLPESLGRPMVGW